MIIAPAPNPAPVTYWQKVRACVSKDAEMKKLVRVILALQDLRMAMNHKLLGINYSLLQHVSADCCPEVQALLSRKERIVVKSDLLRLKVQLKTMRATQLSHEILKLTQMSVGPSPNQRLRNLQMSVHTKL